MTPKLNRREFSKRVALGLIAATLPAASGCGQQGLSCNDPELLSTPEMKLRASQGYAERSPHGEAKSCAQCQFFQEATPGACGNCQILNGPVHPRGYCNSWAAEA